MIAPRSRTTIQQLRLLPPHVRDMLRKDFDTTELTPRALAALAATYAAGVRDGAGLKVDRAETMTPAQVLAVLPVDRKTVRRWSEQGLLRHKRTPGGHRRYVREDVAALALRHGWAME